MLGLVIGKSDRAALSDLETRFWKAAEERIQHQGHGSEEVTLPATPIAGSNALFRLKT